MTQKDIILDDDIMRGAQQLVLHSYCYLQDDCDTQCRLYCICQSNLKAGDMGNFDRWPTKELMRGLELVNGAVHICYRGVTDVITAKGATRTLGRARKIHVDKST